MPTCKLCQLCECKPKAHIVPRWTYRNLTKESHAVIITSDLKRHKSRTRSGEYDKELVCQRCEDRLSKLDTVGAEFFKNTNWSKNSFVSMGFIKNTEHFYRLAPFQKTKSLRLFIVSLLWRFSETSRWMWDDFTLGRRTQNTRELLLGTRKLTTSDFPFVITKYFQPSNDLALDPEQVMTSAKQKRSSGFHCARISLPGFEIQVSTDSRANPHYPTELCFQESHPIVLGLDFNHSPDMFGIERVAKFRYVNLKHRQPK